MTKTTDTYVRTRRAYPMTKTTDTYVRTRRAYLAAELLRGCPAEAIADHEAIAEMLRRGDSAESILSSAECDRWPETYAWLDGELVGIAAEQAAPVLSDGTPAETIRYHITFADDTGSRHAHAYAATYSGTVVSTTQNFDGEGHDLGVIEVDAAQAADIDQALEADDNVISY